MRFDLFVKILVMSECWEALQGVFLAGVGEKGKRKMFKGNCNFMEEAEVLMKLLKLMDFR